MVLKRKVLVCGPRDVDYKHLKTFEQFLSDYENFDMLIIVNGRAKGADTIGQMVCMRNGIEELPYPAEWDKYGRAAGPIRNQQMLDENPDIQGAYVILNRALDETKGTKDMVSRLNKAHIPVTYLRIE